jgi:hypothetical protein
MNPKLSEERDESWSMSRSEVDWLVWPDYEIHENDGTVATGTFVKHGFALPRVKLMTGDDDFVRPIPGPPRGYYPMAHPSLPFQLAKVRFGSREDALLFVREWGLLGYDLIIDPLNPTFYDPLWFIWWHARDVRSVLDLYDALANDDGDALVAAIAERWQPVVQPEGPKGFPMYAEGVTGANITPMYALEKDNPESFGLRIIMRLVSANIEGIRPRVLSRFPGHHGSPLSSIGMAYQFETLIEAIWWHLANVVTGQRDIARCLECHQYFERKDRRQRFCPAPEGQTVLRGGERVPAPSPCSQRRRTSRYRGKPPV